jgi:DeoR family ulaG and ulaABCDEF operon transcriptional repressor
MHAEDRERTILTILENQGFVSLRELDQRLAVSAATIWRDLKRLEIAGRIVRVRGGAKVTDGVSAGFRGAPFNENIQKSPAAKAAIGKAAAALCSAGESIIIDGGSTTLQMCPHLGELELQVFTNSLHIVSALFSQMRTRVSLPSGTLFREQNIVLSAFEDDGTNHFEAAKMFMGAGSVGAQGLMQADVILMQAEQRLMSRSKGVVLLVDSSKFVTPSGHVVCPLGAIDIIISDNRIADAHAQMIERSGPKLIVVGSGSPPTQSPRMLAAMPLQNS